ncbi:MAG: tyrosine-type recombinase/integrase [Anaerolineae bacterium]|nr:tyrosine-type recombinase/integrase [Anaerolineae bacterium]
MAEKTDSQQLSLFAEPEEKPAGGSETALLTMQSSLGQAMGAFAAYMRERGFTENTQQAFRLDMEILADYLGPAKPLGEINTVQLNAYLKWMERDRGVPCRPKTLERRITTLKVFFNWLAEDGSIAHDVAAPLIHHAITAPLPDTLNTAQIQALLDTTQSLRSGTPERKPDVRPHLLLTLILHTGIKKSECVELHLNHFDLVDKVNPALWVRYKRPSRRHKERRIALPTWWPGILQEYLSQYQPRQTLFPCTARNLEYVLTAVAQQAEVPRLTFEMLRWTCAVHDFNEGMPPEELRHKLGLSEISWYEVEPKLALLVQRK